jgi:hypothetical protein
MKLAFWCLVAGAVPALGQAPGVPSISLFARFERAVPDAVLAAIQDELVFVLRPIRVEWHSMPAPAGTPVSGQWAVISFKGRCDVEDLLPEASRSGDLGWTYVSEGTIMPFSDVDCGHIRSFIQDALIAVAPLRRPPVFGRAVGCVLAHEIYHILARTQQHPGCGAGKGAYSVRELLSPTFRFGPRELRTMGASCARSGRGPSGEDSRLVQRGKERN